MKFDNIFQVFESNAESRGKLLQLLTIGLKISIILKSKFLSFSLAKVSKAPITSLSHLKGSEAWYFRFRNSVNFLNFSFLSFYDLKLSF
jgi:hypothetical protein